MLLDSRGSDSRINGMNTWLEEWCNWQGWGWFWGEEGRTLVSERRLQEEELVGVVHTSPSSRGKVEYGIKQKIKGTCNKTTTVIMSDF